MNDEIYISKVMSSPFTARSPNYVLLHPKKNGTKTEEHDFIMCSQEYTSSYRLTFHKSEHRIEMRSEINALFDKQINKSLFQFGIG
jgi:hypothetical protein